MLLQVVFKTYTIQTTMRIIPTVRILDNFSCAPIDRYAADRILDEIPYAYGADYEPEKACLPGTREAIIRAIIAWADDPQGPTVLWLTGFAGSGN